MKGSEIEQDIQSLPLAFAYIQAHIPEKGKTGISLTSRLLLGFQNNPASKKGQALVSFFMLGKLRPKMYNSASLGSEISLHLVSWVNLNETRGRKVS